MAELELHNVTGEGPCLVREYITYLPQFLVQTGTGDLSRTVSLLGVHQGIILDEIGLDYFHYFYGYDQGDGYESI